VPLLPASLIEPLWVEFAALIGSDRPEFCPTHPWGSHRRRVPDWVVFDHVIAALVHGSGYERIATPGCSDRTIRRRLDDWAVAGVGEEVLRAALAGYDQMIGLDLDDLSVDGSITKSPCGGEVSGRSPVDRGKQGTKRSVACNGDGIPLHLVAARANDHDSPLLEPTLPGICDMIGPLPQHRDGRGRDIFPTLHLNRALRLGQDPRPAGDPRLRRRDRGQRCPGPDPGRQTVAGRADPLVDERLRQAAPVHRQTQGHRRVLPLPCRRPDRDPAPDQPSPDPLPLASPAHHPPTPLAINCRSL
jgi:hypothetical protein